MDEFPWLVADIGGTNARFGLVHDATLQVRQVQQLRGADHSGPAAAARAYLAQQALEMAQRGEVLRAPRLAAFAVATAISGDRVELTNSPWSFSRQAVAADLALDALLVLNDFEALALSLPTLKAAQVRAHRAAPTPQGALAVVGPGTGLGVAGMIQTAGGWQPVPGEGGHVTLAPGDDFESELLAVVRRQFEHVSAERLLSGIGLPTLHQAVAQVTGASAPPLNAAQISDQAVAGSDPVCVRTVDTFCALLGSVAGNLALTLGSRGGVYIGGGIVPRWGELFFRSRFRERFEAKGRFRAYLEAIPTALITDTQVALSGAAVAIERHLCDFTAAKGSPCASERTPPR